MSTQMLTSLTRITGYGSVVLADNGAVVAHGQDLSFGSLQMADGGQLVDLTQTTGFLERVYGARATTRSRAPIWSTAASATTS